MKPDAAAQLQAIFERQGLMRTLGAKVVHGAPGEVHLSVGLSEATTQHNGFMHAGAYTAIMDSACGGAAFTLWDGAVGVLTSEFKVNLLRPARGDVTAKARVLKSGRNQTVCLAEAWAKGKGDTEQLIAVMTAALVPVWPRD